VSANPDCTISALAEGIGMKHSACVNAVTRLCKTGMIVSETKDGLIKLNIGREMLAPRYESKEAAKQAAVQRQLVRNALAKEERRKARERRRQSGAESPTMHDVNIKKRPTQLVNHVFPNTDEFIAANQDRYEVIPPTWQPPVRYPRMALSYQERSGRGGLSS
jgi:hypothetical protein